jgi:hypothetical protein
VYDIQPQYLGQSAATSKTYIQFSLVIPDRSLILGGELMTEKRLCRADRWWGIHQRLVSLSEDGKNKNIF